MSQYGCIRLDSRYSSKEYTRNNSKLVVWRHHVDLVINRWISVYDALFYKWKPVYNYDWTLEWKGLFPVDSAPWIIHFRRCLANIGFVRWSIYYHYYSNHLHNSIVVNNYITGHKFYFIPGVNNVIGTAVDRLVFGQTLTSFYIQCLYSSSALLVQ